MLLARTVWENTRVFIHTQNGQLEGSEEQFTEFD